MNKTQKEAKNIQKRVHSWKFEVEGGSVTRSLVDNSITVHQGESLGRYPAAILDAVIKMGPVLGLILASRLMVCLPGICLQVTPVKGGQHYELN